MKRARAGAGAVALLAAAMLLAGCTGGGSSVTNQANNFSFGGQVANENGVRSYDWQNDGRTAMVSWGGQAASGSLGIQVHDATGRRVYSDTIEGTGQGAGSGQSDNGVPGTWKIRLDFRDFTGQMGLSITRGG